MSELWRGVLGFESSHEVSTLGRVRSSRSGTVMALHTQRTGMPYQTVRLKSEGRRRTARVHVLVLEAFAGPRPAHKVACHGEAGPTDNSLRNLRWDTQQSNIQDAIRDGHNHELNKTHCPQQHPYDAANTYVRPSDGARLCRTCRRNDNRRRSAMRRYASPPSELS